MRTAVHFAIGLIFGLGLVVSGMVDPTKVQNFLDLFGSWDPSLAFVLVGAVVVTFAGYRLAWRNATPMLDDQFHLPRSRAIDRRLLLGAAIFGTGWGLSGYCPGPALTALGLLAPGTIVFVPAMLVGMWLARMTANATERVPVSSKS
ncbi:MAG: YeeE/YedE family protein [Hyphomicrobiales bacterium]